MQTAQEEEYVFYRFASGDMLQALSTLKDLPKYRKQTTRHALLQQAVLSYCRPFKNCHGRHGKYKLGASFIPEQYIDLHQELTKHRDQVYAHTDLNIRKPSLKRWRAEGGTWFPIQFKSLSPQFLEKSVPKFRELISIVLKRIQQHTSTLETWLP